MPNGAFQCLVLPVDGFRRFKDLTGDSRDSGAQEELLKSEYLCIGSDK
jgi:hypothetical protein